MEYRTTNLTKYYPTSFHCMNLEFCFYWSCAYCASKFGGLCSDLPLQIDTNDQLQYEYLPVFTDTEKILHAGGNLAQTILQTTEG